MRASGQFGAWEPRAEERRDDSAVESRRRLVVVAHDVGGIGGMEYVHAELIRKLAATYEISVLSTTLAPELRDLVTWDRIRVPRRPVPLKFLTFYVVAAIRICRHRESVIHSCGAIVPNRVMITTVHFCHAASRAAGRRGTRGLRSWARWLNRRLLEAIALGAERWSYRPDRLRVAHVGSAALAREVRRHYPAIPIEVIPFGIDSDRFRPDCKIRDEVRLQAGASADDVIALFAGGDWQRKGLECAIQALAHAANASVAAGLWVVGKGDVQRFAELASELGVSNRVKFFPQTARIERFYKAADLFVLPSAYEGFSLATLEAASSGLPVVATPVGMVPELVRTARAGLLVDREPRAVAAALVELAGDRRRRFEMGQAGRRWVEKRFGSDAMATQFDLLVQAFDVRLPATGERR